MGSSIWKNIFTINEDYTIDTISGIGLSKKRSKIIKWTNRNNNSNINRRSKWNNNMGKF